MDILRYKVRDHDNIKRVKGIDHELKGCLRIKEKYNKEEELLLLQHIIVETVANQILTMG